jgi:hypothetical protein
MILISTKLITRVYLRRSRIKIRRQEAEKDQPCKEQRLEVDLEVVLEVVKKWLFHPRNQDGARMRKTIMRYISK